MTKARQKGVRKVNEMKTKVRETSGDYQGYIECIEKFNFGNLPVEDRRTNEGWRKIFTKSPTETPRLGFSSQKRFFSLISSDPQIPGGLNDFVLPSSPYL